MDLPVYAIILAILVGLYMLRGVFGSPGMPPFLRPKTRPALYVFAGTRDPDMIKVGFTRRMIEDRQVELERDCGQALEPLLCIRMPHAWYAEQRAHAALRQAGWQIPRAANLGTEWYRVPLRKRSRMIEIVKRASEATERQARWRLSWPKGVTRRTYDLARQSFRT